MAFNFEKWCRVWQSAGLKGDGSVAFAKLKRTHGQWWRAYHNAEHVADCWRRLDEVLSAGEPLDDADLVFLAIGYHDAIYVPWLPRNEERSAAWAAKDLAAAGLARRRVERVRQLILATRHGQIPDFSDGHFMVDIDLSILAAERERFDRYESQIRREYRWVGAARFRQGRIAVLRGFLDRPNVFCTQYFRLRLEERAKDNLRRSLAHWQAGGGIAGP